MTSKLCRLAFVMVLALNFSACGTGIKGMAKAVSQGLNVPVALNTDDSDVCAVQQLSDLEAQYENLPSDQQAQVKREARHYTGITINATVRVGTYSGTLTELRYTGYQGNVYVSLNKTLTDERQGPDAKTQLDKSNNQLTITTQNRIDTTTAHDFYTSDRYLYDLIANMSDPVFTRALSAGYIEDQGTRGQPDFACGSEAQLMDLL